PNSFGEFLARYLQGQQQAAGTAMDLSRLLSRGTVSILHDATRRAVEHGHGEVDVLHVLHAMATNEPVRRFLGALDVDEKAMLEAIEQRLPAARSGNQTG